MTGKLRQLQGQCDSLEGRCNSAVDMGRTLNQMMSMSELQVREAMQELYEELEDTKEKVEALDADVSMLNVEAALVDAAHDAALVSAPDLNHICVAW